MSDIRTHRRILDTLTGPRERVLLRAIAARLPLWVTPDLLTAVGVIGGMIVLIGYWLSGISPAFLWLASLGFVVNWFGDSLDGTLARVRHIERPVYGFYIDHAVDAYIEIMVFLGLGLSPYVRFDVACLALIGYLLISVLVYIRTAVKGEFAISYGRLGPTEARLIAIGANTIVFFVGNPLVTLGSVTLTIYDWTVIGLIVLMLGIALSTTIKQARILADWDRKERLAVGVQPPAEKPAGARAAGRKTRKKADRARSPAGKKASATRQSPDSLNRLS